MNLGDEIAYHVSEQAYSGGWQVLTKNEETGEVIIISKNSVEDVHIFGYNQTLNAIERLNTIATKYLDTNYATTARSAKGEDINNLINANVISINAKYWMANIFNYTQVIGGTTYKVYGLEYIDNNGNHVSQVLDDWGTEIGRTNGMRPIITLKENIKTSGQDEKRNMDNKINIPSIERICELKF